MEKKEYTKLIKFPIEFCSLEAIQKALYRLSSFITADIETSKSEITIKINSNLDTKEDDFLRACEELKKFILDESLREKIKKETEAERNLILGIAFSKTKFTNDE